MDLVGSSRSIRTSGLAVAAVLLSVSACTSGSAPQGRTTPHISPATRTPERHSRGPTAASTRPPTAPPIARPRPLGASTGWQLTKPVTGHTGLSAQIMGFTNPVSVVPGGHVSLMVSTSAPGFSVTAYRIGGYRGGDARRVWSVHGLRGRLQPPPVVTTATRTVVAHWQPSVRIATHGWPAGFYLFKLTASTGYQSYVPFTVRSPSTAGRVVLVAPVMDWEAYNNWGGYDLYQAPPGHERSWAVSFDRPYPGKGAGPLLYNVIGTAVLAERLGVPLAFETDVDVAADPHLLDGARGYVSLGHDEYWSVPERQHVTRARDAGTDIAFLSSNSVYWRVRLRRSWSGPDRLEIGYKSDAASADPVRLTHPRLTTARWRDPPAADPENSLTGMLYECYPVDAPYRVASPHWWGFRGTGVRRGTELPGLVADEADRVYPVPSTPRPLEILSYVKYDCGGVQTSSESTYYTTPSGAGVIDFGTQRWSCAVQPQCEGIPGSDDRFVERVTGNVLRAFAAGPVGRVHPAHDNVGDFWLPMTNQVPGS